jgi:hypothetical protein
VRGRAAGAGVGIRAYGAQPSSATLRRAAPKIRRDRPWAATGDSGRIGAPRRERPQSVSRPSSDCDPGPRIAAGPLTRAWNL